VTAGVCHKTALVAAVEWKRQWGGNGNKMTALCYASPFRHRKQHCLQQE